jgi:ubiquitin-activating enzyme E1
MITGLACLEMYKVIMGSHVDDTLNSFVNLAVNVYSMANPTPPKKNVSKVRRPAFPLAT